MQETTANRPTSSALTPAFASAPATASLPSGSASVTYRRMRAPVPHWLTSSVSGSATPCRVTTPDDAQTRSASREPS
ncbi:MAG TPA: hypothetical protein VNQ77_11475 [Frankiaceae bacterium]|nr:hypothetical protein [Frankiaceae bacterium]